MSAFVETNIIGRHITGEHRTSPHEPRPTWQPNRSCSSPISSSPRPSTSSSRSTRRLATRSAPRCVRSSRSALWSPSNLRCFLRALEVYELERIDFAEAYLVACAESSGVNRIASFDRSLDRVGTIERIEPPAT